MLYLDAGTTYSKIIETDNNGNEIRSIIPTVELSSLSKKFDGATGHLAQNYLKEGIEPENEILALAYGSKKLLNNEQNYTILDIGSRDTKWVRFENGKYKELNWNTACASATGATIEMIGKFYALDVTKLKAEKEKYPVTCGIFGMEKIMDEITRTQKADVAVAKYIHGVAFNAWNFAQKPEKLYLSGGFCENECFINSLKFYTEVICLGRFVLAQGLYDISR